MLLRLAPILLILLAAAVLRLYRLDVLPPGMFSDIATNGLDIRDVFAGHPRVFFPANNGREALFIYFQAVLVAGGGNHLYVYTFAAVAMGMLSVALTYRLLRTMFGYRVGVVAAGLMAVAMWGVAASRVGLRFSSVPAFLLAVLYMLWRLFHTGRRRYAVAGGVLLGLAMYTYPSARLIPLLVVLLCAVEWRLALKVWRQLAMLVLVSLAVFVPEGAYFVRHPDQILGRAAQVSVFTPDAQVERSHDTLLQATAKTAGMFFVHGDENQRYNIPGRPVFDPPIAAFFALGLAILLWRLKDRTAYAWLLLWLLVACLPSALSQSSPDEARIYSAAPAAFGLAALGFQALAAAIPGGLTGVALPAAGIAWTCAWTYLVYFGTWAADPKTYDAFGGAAYNLSHFLATRPEQQIVLDFHDRWPIELLTPKTTQAHWFREDTTALALPSAPNGDSLFVTAPFAALSSGMPQILPGLEPLPHTTAATGVADFLAYRWPQAQAQGWFGQVHPTDATFGGDFRLKGWSITGQGSARTLNLLWQPLAASGPYDLFIHLLDSSAKQIAQSDSDAWPAEDGPGDYLLLTQIRLDLPPGAYSADVGAVHRSAADPRQLAGGPIGQPVRLPIEVAASGS